MRSRFDNSSRSSSSVRAQVSSSAAVGFGCTEVELLWRFVCRCTLLRTPACTHPSLFVSNPLPRCKRPAAPGDAQASEQASQQRRHTRTNANRGKLPARFPGDRASSAQPKPLCFCNRARWKHLGKHTHENLSIRISRGTRRRSQDTQTCRGQTDTEKDAPTHDSADGQKGHRAEL